MVNKPLNWCLGPSIPADPFFPARAASPVVVAQDAKPRFSAEPSSLIHALKDLIELVLGGVRDPDHGGILPLERKIVPSKNWFLNHPWIYCIQIMQFPNLIVSVQYMFLKWNREMIGKNWSEARLMKINCFQPLIQQFSHLWEVSCKRFFPPNSVSTLKGSYGRS